MSWDLEAWSNLQFKGLHSTTAERMWQLEPGDSGSHYTHSQGAQSEQEVGLDSSRPAPK